MNTTASKGAHRNPGDTLLRLFVCICLGSSTPAFFDDAAAFTAHTITTSANFAASVAAADLDGDGDMDVLSASRDDSKIAWYENTDGLGTFGPQQIISQLASGAISVTSADLDGDGDIDVISGSPYDDEIAWYENTDGAGSFGPQHIVSNLADGAIRVFAADVDGDGDIDVLSVSTTDNKVAWYENILGTAVFAPQQIVGYTSGAHGIFVADLDSDGDNDVLAGGFGDNKVVWFENTDGAGSFGPRQTIDTLAGAPFSVIAADLDGDSDVDVVAVHGLDDKVCWWENTTGTGAFGSAQIITTSVDLVQQVKAVDMDGDGDLDVISVSSDDDKVAWYENTDGLGTFGAQQVIATSADRPVSIFAADLNGDGGMDVLSASTNDDKIAWYEGDPVITAAPAPVRSYDNDSVSASPNPFNPLTTITYRVVSSGPVRVQIHDVMGRLIDTLVDEVVVQGSHRVVWTGRDRNGTLVHSGVYIVSVDSGGQIQTTKITLVM